MSLPPLPFVNFIDEDGLWESQYGPYSKETMEDYGRACRTAALEEAAKVCDGEPSMDGDVFAAAIRALKEGK